MNELYNGKLNWEDVSVVKAELIEIEKEMSKQSPADVIWEKNDISKIPPWGDIISPKVTNLANYFATSDGKTFFEVMHAAMDVAVEDKCDLKFINYNT
ncbi:immunity 70 family protein [Bacillus infantis]|nr:immunity 70 family protein [Bacillus infantis]